MCLAVDNVILKIIENRFVDGNGGKYSHSLIHVGNGASAPVVDVYLNHTIKNVVSKCSNIENLKASILACRKEAWRLQTEIHNHLSN